jgi:hypothetical protein
MQADRLLKSDEFTSAKGFKKYARLVARAAEECGVGFDTCRNWQPGYPRRVRRACGYT